MLGLSNMLGKETVVGIDIGSRWMKVAFAESAGQGCWKVSRIAIIPTPEGGVKDGNVVDKQGVAAALRQLLKSANLGHATGAVAAISGAGVIVRHAKMPRISEAVLRKSIRYEAAKYISSSVDDSVIEFEILGPVPGEPDKMYVTLVAAPNEMVNSRLETLDLAGLEPVSIDVEAFALQRVLLECTSTHTKETETLAILDIGSVKTDVNIVSNGQFALTRNIPIAGDHFTNAIKSAKKCDWNDAEALKKQVDLSLLLKADSDPEGQALAKIVQPVIDELLREVRRSTNYYHTQVSEGALQIPGVDEPQEVSRLVVTGGSGLLQGIDKYMAARLGSVVETWNVFDNPSLIADGLSDDFIAANHTVLALCVSLALKEAVSTIAPKKTPAKPNLKVQVETEEEDPMSKAA
jgi:type IV pilus assembly protein PilM